MSQHCKVEWNILTCLCSVEKYYEKIDFPLHSLFQLLILILSSSRLQNYHDHQRKIFAHQIDRLIKTNNNIEQEKSQHNEEIHKLKLELAQVI